MPNLLRLRGADGSIVDFEDRSKVESFKFIGPPGATIQRTISPLGCGGCGGPTASLDSDRYLYTTRKYEISLWDNGRSILDGGSFHQVELHAQEFEHAILKASWHNRDFSNPPVCDPDGNDVTACAVWLERRLYDQPTPEVWTVLTGTRGKTGRIHEERYGIPRIVLELSFDCMEGATALDSSGFPIDAAYGGTLFMPFAFPPSPAIAYGGTLAIPFTFF